MPYLGVKPADEFTSKDLNGEELILDADADTTITADTDDQIDIRIAGADDFQFTANTFTAQSGSTIAAQALTGTTGVFSSDVTGLTINATGDTAASDNAAIGYTAAEGLILTGQGSTNDITIKNDADADVLTVATGGTTAAFLGDVTLPSAGELFVGDTANSNMTTGLTINQGAADNAVFTLKSSDVAHGQTSLYFNAETDDILQIAKSNMNTGGISFGAFAENVVTPTIAFYGIGTTPSTSPSTSANPTFQFYGCPHDDNNGVADYVANALIFGVSGRVGGTTRRLWFIDEDGDTHADGTHNNTVFDEHDDALVCRSLDLMRSPKSVIKSEFDNWTKDHRKILEDVGVISKLDPSMPEYWTEEGNRADPMLNVSQLQRLHNGAIVQQRLMFETLKEVAEELLPGFADKLNERLESKSLPALPV